jgi:NTE family protein
MSKSTLRIAVVLAGAVAKGAFEAGVLQALAEKRVEIVRIVGSSSGALNGTLLASAVRKREVAQGAAELVELWRDKAGWTDVFHASFEVLRTRQGVSDRAKVLELLRRYVTPSPTGADIDLRLLTAPLAGTAGTIGLRPATTYEAMMQFTGKDFATTESLVRVFDGATASSAFPLVFAPVEVEGLGPCVDGGAVNNTPLKWALDGTQHDRIDAIVVVATSPELRLGPPPADLHAIELASHLANMLIGERLYRDLHDAADVNASLARLDELVAQGVLDSSQLGAVRTAIGWDGFRNVKIVEVRPLEDLPGSSFSGFFDDSLREQYIQAGITRARDVLASL